MRNLFLLFFLLTFIGSNAQKSNSQKGSGLSKYDLERAKELYIKMTKSEAYIEYRKSMAATSIKRYPLTIPSPEEINSEKDLQNWLNDVKAYFIKDNNINKSKYKSVEEAMNDIKKEIELLRKIKEKNREVYSLMKKANIEQIREIIEPSQLNFYETIDNYSRQKH